MSAQSRGCNTRDERGGMDHLMPWFHGPISREEAEQLLAPSSQNRQSSAQTSNDGELEKNTLACTYLYFYGFSCCLPVPQCTTSNGYMYINTHTRNDVKRIDINGKDHESMF